MAYVAQSNRVCDDAFEQKIYDGTIMKEMQDAVASVKSTGGVDSIEPLGIVCPEVFAKDVHQQFKKDPPPKQMSFSATIWMLDLDHRIMPLERTLQG